MTALHISPDPWWSDPCACGHRRDLHLRDTSGRTPCHDQRPDVCPCENFKEAPDE